MIKPIWSENHFEAVTYSDGRVTVHGPAFPTYWVEGFAGARRVADRLARQIEASVSRDEAVKIVERWYRRHGGEV